MGGGYRRSSWYNELLPFVALVTMECMIVGGTTMFKAATSIGLNDFVFVSYTYLVATLVLLPFPFIISRRRKLSPLSFSIVYKLVLIGVIGYFDQALGYIGISYASPTLASIIGNLTPAFTFILAVVFRMEKLKLESYSFQAKIMGTIVSIAGATIVTVYRGPTIMSPSSPSALPRLTLSSSSSSSWVIGGILLSIEFFLLSAVYIVQTSVMKEYPEEVVVAFVNSLVGFSTSAIVGFSIEKNLGAWKVKPGIELLSVVYMGLFGGAISGFIKAWSLRLKGPVYVATFKPSSVVFAVIMGVIFLRDVLYLGSLLGTVIVAIGFYAVLWGKANEEKDEYNQNGSFVSTSSSEQIPFLKNKNTEDWDGENGSFGASTSSEQIPFLKNKNIEDWETNV